jgi:hypothetical protein
LLLDKENVVREYDYKITPDKLNRCEVKFVKDFAAYIKENFDVLGL